MNLKEEIAWHKEIHYTKLTKYYDDEGEIASINRATFVVTIEPFKYDPS